MKLLEKRQGILMIGRGTERVKAFVMEAPEEYRPDFATGIVKDTVRENRGFCTVLFAPALEKLEDVWTDIILLDGDILPGEAALIHERCPSARLHGLEKNEQVLSKLKPLQLTRELLGKLYPRLKKGGSTAPSVLSKDCGLSVWQTLFGLQVFNELGLIEHTREPWLVRLIPDAGKKDLEDSVTLKYLRGLPC